MEIICLGSPIILIAVPIIVGWIFLVPLEAINRWASANRYKLVASRCCWPNYGPIGSRAGGQCVYHVTVLTADGDERRGWVHCGRWWRHAGSDVVEVAWDD